MQATNEQIADAALAALKAAAGNEYTMQMIAVMLTRLPGTGLPQMPPLDERCRLMKGAYNNTIRFLPADSPFREPMERTRDLLIAGMPEDPGPNPFGN